MAEDTVPSELFSGQFPVNRERYRDFSSILRNLMATFRPEISFQSHLSVPSHCFHEKWNRDFNLHNRADLGD
jgi:hypothetical protein